MRKLVEKGLLNDGLIPLTPTIKVRYDRCLARAGIGAAHFKTGEVDGIGWSPQHARAVHDPYYLCNGVENPVFLIVSPKQYKKPAFMPLFSWSRSLMRAFWEHEDNHRKIIDVCATHAVLIYLENSISNLKSATDLLHMREITAIPDCGTLARAAQEQAQLISRYYEGESSLDNGLLDAIMRSRREHGDLRKRQVLLEPMKFSSFRDFHTVAFGGAAVLRRVGLEDFLVVEDKAQFDKVAEVPEGARAYHLFDESREVFHKLVAANWLVLPIDKFKADPRLLAEKLELLLASSLCDCEDGLEWSDASPSMRRSLMKKHGHKVPAIYDELERYAETVKSGGKPPEPSQELWYFLAEPGELPPSTREVLWILLTRLDPRNLLESYTCDKNRFLAEYDTWTAQKQTWAADYLAARYRKQMLQP